MNFEEQKFIVILLFALLILSSGCIARGADSAQSAVINESNPDIPHEFAIRLADHYNSLRFLGSLAEEKTAAANSAKEMCLLADDVYRPEHLEIYAKFIEDKTRCIWIYDTSAHLYNAEIEFLSLSKVVPRNLPTHIASYDVSHLNVSYPEAVY